MSKTKKKTKAKKKGRTESSSPKTAVPKSPPVLTMKGLQVLSLLKEMDQMTLLHAALPSVQDLGVLDLETWGGGFGNLFTETFEAIWNEKGELHDHLHPILRELEDSSSCAGDAQTLTFAFAKIIGVSVFVNLAMDRHS